VETGAHIGVRISWPKIGQTTCRTGLDVQGSASQPGVVGEAGNRDRKAPLEPDENDGQVRRSEH